MASFKKTNIKSFPRVGEKVTKDSLYWKHLEFPVTRKGFGAVTYIEFSPVEPYHYAVTNSTKVEIFSCRSHQVVRTLARFREQAFSGSFRSDGKLLVAGGEEGLVRLFDVGGKTLLRTFKGHERPVHVTRFTSDNLHIMSGGDDQVVRLYDIPSETEVVAFKEHQDYIRGGAISKTSKDIFITGSYDHTVKLFDARTDESVLTVNHGHPVECVLMHPTGNLFYSAGGEVIKVWDALAGGRLLASFNNHHKTITTLCFCSNYKRLLSGGLDRHVKFYDTSTFQVVHSLDYVSAVLSLGVSEDDGVISVGMSDGYLVSQKRREAEEIQQEKLEEKRKKKSSYKFRVQVQRVPSKNDHIIHFTRREKLAKYDKYFKNFQHSKALDAALDLRVRSINPEVTISVFQELIRRGAIKAALAGRDEKSLSMIIKFLHKTLSNPKFTETVIDITNMITDLYKDQIGQSSKLCDLMKILKATLDKEVSYVKDMMEVMGILDTMFATSQAMDSKGSDHFGSAIDATTSVPVVTNGGVDSSGDSDYSDNSDSGSS